LPMASTQPNQVGPRGPYPDGGQAPKPQGRKGTDCEHGGQISCAAVRTSDQGRLPSRIEMENAGGQFGERPPGADELADWPFDRVALMISTLGKAMPVGASQGAGPKRTFSPGRGGDHDRENPAGGGEEGDGRGASESDRHGGRHKKARQPAPIEAGWPMAGASNGPTMRLGVWPGFSPRPAAIQGRAAESPRMTAPEGKRVSGTALGTCVESRRSLGGWSR